MASKGFFVGGLLQGIGKGGENVAKSVIDRERDEAMALREENMARLRQSLEDTSWDKRNATETATRREDAETAFGRQKELATFETEEKVRGEGLLTPVILEREQGKSDIEVNAKKSELINQDYYDEKSNKWYRTNQKGERVDVGVPETISRERMQQAAMNYRSGLEATTKGREVKAGEANSAKSDLSELYGYKMLEMLGSKEDDATIASMNILSSDGAVNMPRLMAVVSAMGPEGKQLVDEYVAQKDVVGQALDAGNNPLRATPAAERAKVSAEFESAAKSLHKIKGLEGVVGDDIAAAASVDAGSAAQFLSRAKAAGKTKAQVLLVLKAARNQAAYDAVNAVKDEPKGLIPIESKPPAKTEPKSVKEEPLPAEYGNTTKTDLLAVPKRVIKSVSEMTPSAQKQLFVKRGDRTLPLRFVDGKPDIRPGDVVLDASGNRVEQPAVASR